MKSLALTQGDVAASFSAAAPDYDGAASLQRRVCALLGRFAKLESLQASRVLDLGCGTGASQARLRRALPQADQLGLDIAQGMLSQAQRQHPVTAWITAAADALPLEGQCVDLIYANLCLQWCDNLEQVFAECRRVLRPGGMLCFSTLGPDTLQELRAAWATVDDLPHVNEFTAIQTVCSALQQAGMKVLEIDQNLLLEEYPDVVSLCRNLKSIGAHNLNAGRSTGLVGRRRFRVMTDAYEQHRQRNELLPASWDVLLLKATR